ncbi:MAG: glycosyltransferase, partial [Proteobacteria bacterium]|nr:glycosyltransferase [Pseudomonadota bacterium]
LQAFFLMLRLRPSIVFSKGGFVSVPVAIGARLAGVPVVSHESDYSPGLANRIIAVFAKKIIYSFPETGQYLKEGTGEYVPCPIRRELYTGDRNAGLAACGFGESPKPVVLIMGGSLGAQRLNDVLLAILPRLILECRVVHLTGRGKMISFQNTHYCAFEFWGEGLKDVYAITDMVISRAGANSIFEMLALKIPMLLVPLGLGSRGDQILNAKSFEKKGWAHVLLEENVTPDSLYAAIDKLKSSSRSIKSAQSGANLKEGGAQIVDILNKLSGKF